MPYSLNDLCVEALAEAGVFSLGQSPAPADVADALVRLGNMLGQWAASQLLVFHNTTVGVVATGQASYSVGPGQQFNSGMLGGRPSRLVGAFARRVADGQQTPGTSLVSASASDVDFPMRVLQSSGAFQAIRLKALSTQPEVVWYDNQWPSGTLYVWPVPPAGAWVVFATWLAALPIGASAGPNGGLDPTAQLSFPPEYKDALVLNLALRLRSRWRIPTFPGDMLKPQADAARKTIMQANFQVPTMSLPSAVGQPFGRYNIFSDDVG